VTRTLLYTKQAQGDLDQIFDFIATDNPHRARTYIEEIRQACLTLCLTPMIGIARPDLQSDLRILPLWRRIVIAYQVMPDRIDVLRVFSGGQDYEMIMGGD